MEGGPRGPLLRFVFYRLRPPGPSPPSDARAGSGDGGGLSTASSCQLLASSSIEVKLTAEAKREFVLAVEQEITPSKIS